MTTTGIRTMIFVAGLAAGLAAPASAEVGPADAQAIARSLAGQGYSDVRIAEDDGEVTVSARRDGETHSFAYDREEGRLEPVGGEGDDGPRGPEADDDGPDDDSPGDDGRSGRDRGDDGGRGDDDDGDDHGGHEDDEGGDDDSGRGGDDGGGRGTED